MLVYVPRKDAFFTEKVGKTGPRKVRRLEVPCEPVQEFSVCDPILAGGSFRSRRQILIFGRTIRIGLRNPLGQSWVGEPWAYFEIFLPIAENHVEIRLALQPLRFIGGYCSQPGWDDHPLRWLRSSFAGSHYP